MKIVLLYRKRATGGFSIEEIFRSVADALRDSAQVIDIEVGSRWQVLSDVLRLWRIRADIYHVTGDINYFVLLLPWCKTVLTVHDIGHYLYGLRGIRRWLYGWLWLKLPIRMAARVTAVSAQTRADITKYLKGVRNDIEVIENCHSPIYRPIAKPFETRCPRVLQVGAKPYKNVPRLVEALKGIRCCLVIIGEVDAGLQEILEKSGLEYECHVNLSRAEVYEQYLQSDLVSFVSEGEGFGMPIIEAQAVGRPLITANIPPMSDVAGEGACLVDPMDVGAIRAGLRRIIDDEAYRAHLVAQGFKNVTRFSSVAIGNRYRTLYTQLAPT